MGLRLGWWEVGYVRGGDAHTMGGHGDLQEGYAGGRHGVILPGLARYAWVLQRTGLSISMPLPQGLGRSSRDGRREWLDRLITVTHVTCTRAWQVVAVRLSFSHLYLGRGLVSKVIE